MKLGKNGFAGDMADVDEDYQSGLMVEAVMSGRHKAANANLEAAKQAQEKLRHEAQALVDVAEAEGRELSKDEESRFNTIMDIEIPSAKRNAKLAEEEIESCTPRPSGSAPRILTPNRGPIFEDRASGRRIQGRLGHEPISGRPYAGDIHADFGSWVADSILGPGFRAQQQEGDDSLGGYMVPSPLQVGVIDLLRSKMVTTRAGAVTVPMTSATLDLTKSETDPTSAWRSELEAIVASDATFSRITLTARSVACLVPLSEEILQDGQNTATIITDAITSSMARVIDLACLAGSGTPPEPRGVRNTSGVNAITTVGIPTDYSEITDAVKQIMQANYLGEVSGLSWVANPRDRATFDSLLATDNQPLQPTPWASQLRQLDTTAVAVDEGAGSDSYMIVGDYRNLVIGWRQDIRVDRLRTGTGTDSGATTWNALDQLLYWIRVSARMDCAVTRADQFSLLTGVQAA